MRGILPAAQLEYVARIQRNQRHLLGLINDVLNFARLEIGHVEIMLEDMPVDRTLAKLHELIEPQLAAKSLSYSYKGASNSNAADGELTARTDPEKFRQVMLNLLSNAIKFTEDGGSIDVSWSATDLFVEVRVADTGRGIAPDKLSAVFEPFVQLERNLSQPAEGAGLGLAISRDLARTMNGELAVESQLNVGSTFIFTLPRT